ncbi:hypothetical protein APUTEX25_003272 [Auxenochlorella protothecoides]|uniref:C3H1-type domain-containing protein n=1 Tax=Auxenochlorella protothecoides TaxID=3075 RepID=A0A3M7KUL2_AUXPR|nr:hypothetical protein APUTEX25_003272 [Auxenochlorella protothecoides]|eukprot:RMZ53450.1 hypothetical protein APUTEX25_003272 [Auxenochlorella protothecoides]
MELTATAPRRLARAQVHEAVTGREEKHPAGTVNIWTGRRLAGHGAREKGPRVASKYKCHPETDQGWTRGEGSGASYCCLYFASRGLCHHGAECNYLHRLPDEGMEARHARDHAVDIFGRDRNPASRDGRKRGTGSYERECRTLYVNYGGAGVEPSAMHAAVRAGFGAWGPVEDVHVAAAKTLAFVRFRWRSSAEFAKAAMHQQSLAGVHGAEVLDVRWANDDPNPRAARRVQREREEAMRDAYVQAVNTADPVAKRARLQQLHLAAMWKPDTSDQYGDSPPPGYSGWDEYYYQDRDQAPDGASDALHGPQGSAGHEGAAEAGEDDISRYLTSEELAELTGGGGGKGEDGGQARTEGSDPCQGEAGDASGLVSLLAAYDSD